MTTTVLDEGVDVPDAEVAIILSGSGQPRQLIQRVGRVIRYKRRKIAYVYEFVTEDTIEWHLHSNRYIYVHFLYCLWKMDDIIRELEEKWRAEERVGKVVVARAFIFW